MAWHNGLCWPLYTSTWYSPKVSQYMFDPYSFTHVLDGVIFQLISSRTIPFIAGGFLGCMLFELGWELLENSEFLMRRFHENSCTSWQYYSDSVQNIIGDLLSGASGFVMVTFFQRSCVWLASLLWKALSEVRFSENNSSLKLYHIILCELKMWSPSIFSWPTLFQETKFLVDIK